MKESQIQKTIIDGLQKRFGAWVHKLDGHIAGTPDLIAAIPTSFFVRKRREPFVFFIEVKQPGKNPSDIQSVRIDELERHGFTVIVADCWDDVLEFVDKVTR